MHIPPSQTLPHTRDSLAGELAELGLRRGEVVLVHSSLSSLGWVCGGSVAVVQALRDVLGETGTVVVPTQTMGNSDPMYWSRPPVPESWWPVIRDHMPAFDPEVTPSVGIGAIAETVRTWPGAMRSEHPHTSFAALGPAAGELMAVHELESQLGERSPLAALERAGARVLLLGAGFESCTAFHLAEYRVPTPVRAEHATAVRTSAGRKWITYTDVHTNSDDFAVLGATYELTETVTRGRVGHATCRLFPLPEAVAFATTWIPQYRTRPS